MKISKFSKFVSMFLSIMMIAAMIPITALAEEAESYTITVENSVSFLAVDSSDSLGFTYHAKINGNVYVGNYTLFAKNGKSLGVQRTADNGAFTLTPGQKAVIDVKLGDSYEVVRDAFTDVSSYDGNYYNPVDSKKMSGAITDAVFYYYNQNGAKTNITEEKYNKDTNNGEILKFKGYVDGDVLNADYMTTRDIYGIQHSYKSNTLEKASEISVTTVTEMIGGFFKTDFYLASCNYNGKYYSAKLPKSLSTEDMAVANLALKISANNTKAFVGSKTDGVWPVYEAEQVTIVEREYYTESRSNVSLKFDAVVTPALGGTASVTVAYGSRNKKPVAVSNGAGTDTDYNYYTIDSELSKLAINEKFDLDYSTGLEGSHIEALLKLLGINIDDITSAKTSKIEVTPGSTGVTYTFHGLISGLTYTLEPQIALPGYGMPTKEENGITSNSPIKFKVGKPGTNVKISNYVKYTAGNGDQKNTEESIVIFEKETYLEFSKHNLSGKAVKGAEFYMIERDAVVNMLKDLASYDTDWKGVYENVKTMDFSNISWDLVLDIINAYVSNSGVDQNTVFRFPAILKATSDNDGIVSFGKGSNVLAPIAKFIDGEVIDTSTISKIIEIFEKIGIKLPDNISAVITAASKLGKVKFECGMPVGNYILVETKSPKGYKANPIIWTVKVADTSGESVEANNVRIGIIYDVIATMLKDKYGVDIENLVPETIFDENDEAIKNTYKECKDKAKEYIDYVYKELGKYVTLNHKEEFTNAVIARLEKGESLTSAVNYALRYVDGIFGRTIDADFVIYNIEEGSDKEVTLPNDKPAVSEPSETPTVPDDNITSNNDSSKQDVSSAMRDFLSNIIPNLWRKR